MRSRRSLLAASLAAAFAVCLNAPAAFAQDQKVPVIATFSILGDLVKNVGGDRVEVTTLVGSNADSHVYAPTPADAKKVGAAKVVFINGLGFEGWTTRLIKASGSKAPTVTVTKGIRTRTMEADDRGHGHKATDPHAWQSVANTKIYVTNIRDGLIAADPAGKSVYEANAGSYLARLDALEAEVKEAIGKIPADRRRIITSHDAFGYFGAAYGIEFISPTGVSTEAAVSAKDVAKIIAQIRKQKIPAVFMENVTDPRMMEQIAKESGAKIGGRLFSDALSDEKGPAPNYIDMIRNNIHQLATALTS
ncbi:MAG TPA: metal ABC transporter substrate-binding protein [Xanthobacteraceae bacterium]|nr:metal ABC transporter substrate-binding protein [Xanthobacteraceae bacterium]